MIDTKPCPFCGSKDLIIDTPFIDRITRQPKRVPCCKGQKTNIEFRDKRYHEGEEKPELEDISKL